MRMFTFLYVIFQTYLTIISHFLQIKTYKLNIKMNLLEDYVNIVDNTNKQNKYFKRSIILIVLIMFLFLFFLLCQYLK